MCVLSRECKGPRIRNRRGKLPATEWRSHHARPDDFRPSHDTGTLSGSNPTSARYGLRLVAVRHRRRNTAPNSRAPFTAFCTAFSGYTRAHAAGWRLRCLPSRHPRWLAVHPRVDSRLKDREARPPRRRPLLGPVTHPVHRRYLRGPDSCACWTFCGGSGVDLVSEEAVTA